MIEINAVGDGCPIPVVKTLNAIKELEGGGVVQTLVDNGIAVRNLTRMANQRGYGVKSEKREENRFAVTITVSGAEPAADTQAEGCLVTGAGRSGLVVAVSSDRMGTGNDELGKVLLKGFLYGLSQQEVLPDAILFYNGGATVTCEESPSLDDLRSLEAQGVEILTCGTCLNYYGLTDRLKVGEVTNMYTIVEKLTQAASVVKP